MATVTRRGRGRLQKDEAPLQGSSSPTSALATTEQQDKGRKQLRHGLLPLPVKVVVLGCSLALWFFFHPAVLLLSSDDSSSTRNMYNIRKEVVYPRVLEYAVMGQQGDTHHTAPHHRRRRSVLVRRLGSKYRQREIQDSHEYKELNNYVGLEQDDCQLEHAWQSTYRPTCNSLHELDLTSPKLADGSDKYKFLTNGGYRDVFYVVDDVSANMEKLCFKPMLYEQDFST